MIPVIKYHELADPQLSQKQQKSTWNPQYRLIWADYPQQYAKNSRVSQIISVRYKDQAGKMCRKNIKFGTPSDFVFSHDLKLREKHFRQLQPQDNPLHPNYWRLQLLNKFQSIEQGYFSFIDDLRKK